MNEKHFGNDWDDLLADELIKPYYSKLSRFLENEYANEIIYPNKEDRFTAFTLTPFSKVSVVILGQDPYHGAGQAHGLSFSVKPGVKHPPSLRNIFKELSADLGCPVPKDGTLNGWAQQGVLMLNTVLTVQHGQAYSHRKKGWELFTDEVIRQLSNREKPIVFILWGRPAQEKKQLIDLTRHAVVESFHPSPLSANRGFFGSRPFSVTNRILESWGRTPIEWCNTGGTL